MRKALLFSGTSDGSRLALCLAGRGWLVTVCTATEYGERSAPRHVNIRVHAGRMDRGEMEAFLAADAILNIYMNVSSGLVVNDKVVERRVMEKLPFMATENIMMESVKRGGNRQELHEALRVHSHAAAARVKLEGGQNDLIDRIAADPMFPLTKAEILEQLDPKAYTGRSGSQVTEFLRDVVRPLLEQYGNENLTVELRV